MAYVIGRSHKLEKNWKRLDNNTDNSSLSSTPLCSYDKFNKNTDITSKKKLSAEIHFSTIFAVDDKSAVIIHNEYASKPN